MSRTAGPFDATTLPAGLRRAHRVADGVWGRLRVIEGSAGLRLETDPPIDVRLAAGDSQAIPPGVPHAVSVDGPVSLVVDFLVPEPGLAASRSEDVDLVAASPRGLRAQLRVVGSLAT